MPTSNDLQHLFAAHSFSQNEKRYVGKKGNRKFREKLAQIANRGITGSPNPKHVKSGKIDPFTSLNPMEDPILRRSFEELTIHIRGLSSDKPESFSGPKVMSRIFCRNLSEAKTVMGAAFLKEYERLWEIFGCATKTS